ncbi:MAG: hypothetical protein JXA77_16860 [Bacteroidales bacterium]|nr:hypothetical protein [Bacteroidales bacterium]MBN2819372.1 hypothetical protein [Bacteroidales bacterium]
MEYQIDLLKIKHKSTYRVVIGVIFVVITFFWVFNKLIGNPESTWFDFVMTGILLLNGIVHISGGLGFPFESLLGKAYIQVDDKSFLYKPAIYEKEDRFDWVSIKSVEFKSNKIIFNNTIDIQSTVSLAKINYSTLKKIKEAISINAAKNNIIINE